MPSSQIDFVRTHALRCILSPEAICKRIFGVKGSKFLTIPLFLGLLSSKAEGSRALTLFWDKDVFLTPSESQLKGTFRVGAGEAIFAPAQLPCFFVTRPFALAFYTLQVGTSCAVRTGDNHTLAIDLSPEIAFRQSQRLTTLVRPGLKGGLTQSFHLGNGLSGHMVYGSFHYKFTPKSSKGQSGENVKNDFSAFQFQKWNDLFDSVLSVGWILRYFAPFEATQQEAYAVRYYESLPLELRRIGGLEDSSSVSFKAIEASVRFREGPWVFGGGLGYLVLSLDNLRLGLPYPELTVTYEW